MLYRIHAQSGTVDLNVWGPRGYHILPDAESVVSNGPHWTSTGPIEKITRDHAAVLLHWARRHNVQVQRFPR